MATYYRWRKSEADYEEVSVSKTSYEAWRDDSAPVLYKGYSKPRWLGSEYDKSGMQKLGLGTYYLAINTWYVLDGFGYGPRNCCFYGGTGSLDAREKDDGWYTLALNPPLSYYTYDYVRGSQIELVYSLTSNAYPTNGKSGDYWYDQRTTVTSPTAPSGLTYPATITTPSVDVTWTAATSNTNYPVSGYRVDVSTNGGSSWTLAGNPSTNSLHYNITPGTTSIMFRVRAKDSNGQWGSYVTGTASQVLLAPTLTVPQMLMQGQQATINWTAITGADSYTLQRKSSADSDWVQVYSGTALTYSETAGTWTTVQYRVQAVFNGTPGGWATSAEIPVVSASALVISGQDGDLGTLVNDVPYSISTDTGNQITATITVNGAVIFNGNVGNSVADVIPVLDLINGEGTIVIEASVTASSGPVSAVRTWTYTKDLITFPNAGSVAQLTQDGKDVFPKTLAEAVRIPGGKTLDQVMGFPAQIFTGSYVGTGTYGQSNPNTLTFPFEPKAVFVCESFAMDTGNPDTILYFGQPGSTGSAEFSVSGNTFEWFSTSASHQLNNSGETYYYVAIG